MKKGYLREEKWKEKKRTKRVYRERAYLEDIMSIYVDSPQYAADSHLEESWLTVDIDFS